MTPLAPGGIKHAVVMKGMDNFFYTNAMRGDQGQNYCS